MKLDLDTDQMRAVVAAAIMQTMDSVKKDAIIATAIEQLMKPASNAYNAPTTIQQLYESAVREQCSVIIKNELDKNADIKAKLRETVITAMDKVFVEKSEELVGNFAAAISQAFRVRNY